MTQNYLFLRRGLWQHRADLLQTAATKGKIARPKLNFKRTSSAKWQDRCQNGNENQVCESLSLTRSVCYPFQIRSWPLIRYDTASLFCHRGWHGIVAGWPHNGHRENVSGITNRELVLLVCPCISIQNFRCPRKVTSFLMLLYILLVLNSSHLVSVLDQFLTPNYSKIIRYIKDTTFPGASQSGIYSYLSGKILAFCKVALLV